MPVDPPLPAIEDTVLVAPADNVMALAVIRSLGRRGVRVVGASSDSTGLGRHSRFCTASVSLPKDSDQILDALMTLIGEHHVSHLIAMNESMILRLNSQRFRLEKQCRLLFPPTEIFNLAFNKILTLRVAESIGVPTPKTRCISCFDDLDGCRDMKFPVVLKPQHGDVGSLLKFKAMYVPSYSALLSEMERFRSVGEYPLVQEYCVGQGVGVEILMSCGNPVLTFQHERIREYPPTGGAASFVGVPHFSPCWQSTR